MQASKSHNKKKLHVSARIIAFKKSIAYTPCYNNSILENYPK